MFLKKKNSFKISLLGAGNVASQLAPALESAGHAILEIYSRHYKNAHILSEQLYEAEVKHDLDFIESDADFFIIAVPDDYIGEVISKLRLPEHAVLMHTSGSTSLEILKTKSKACAVFYPLQTFSKGTKVNFNHIPILIEGNSQDTVNKVKKLAESISKQVLEMSSEQRAVLHIAAVFACNFTNHMISLAEDLTESSHIDFELLKPLIAETLNKTLNIGPKQAQTGPAIRADHATLDRHINFLKRHDKQLSKLYTSISQSILKGNE